MQSFVAFDLETTGLDLKRDQIIEIAAVRFQLERQPSRDPRRQPNGVLVPKVVGTWQTLTKPTMLIPEGATAVHHITNAMVEDAPAVAEVLPEFARFCGPSTLLVAHNADGFDLPMLQRHWQESRLPMLQNGIIDSLKISRKVWPEAPSHKLGELAARAKREISFEVKSADLHRALYDTQVLAGVFCAMIARYPDKDLQMGAFEKLSERLGSKASKLKSLSA